jgi:hypothetical protein
VFRPQRPLLGLPRSGCASSVAVLVAQPNAKIPPAETIASEGIRIPTPMLTLKSMRRRKVGEKYAEFTAVAVNGVQQ